LRELIHLFKYSSIRTLEVPLGKMIAGAIPRDQRFDAVVPVPLHWFRKWRRGFNQSELLGRAAASRMGIPLLAALRRTRATQVQAGLSRAARRDNIRGAFAVPSPRSVHGLRLLLVDDVLTTGATAGICAAALKRAGAAHVSVLALARADRRALLEHDAVSLTPLSPGAK
jgi:ComF family protein